MKKTTLLKTMLLLCALIVGSSSAWAADQSFTITISSFTDLPNSGSAAYGTYSWTSGGVSGKGQIYADKSSTSMQQNGGKAEGKLFYNTTAIPGSIKKINIIKDSGSNRSYSVYGRASAFSGSGTSYGTLIATANTQDGNGRDYTFSTGDYSYFVIVYTTSNASYLKSITVTYDNVTKYTLSSSVSPASSGTVSLGATSLAEGGTTTITATPNSGYHFVNWTVSGTGSSVETATDASTTFTMGTENATVTANFEVNPAYTVTFGDGGSVTEASSNAGVTLPSRSDVVDYSFVGWSETNLTTEVTVAPTIIPAGEYHPEGDVTLYPVYTRTENFTSEVNKTVSIKDYAEANSWVDSKKNPVPTSGTATQSFIYIDAVATATSGTGSNSGKYYTTDNTWRIYEETNGGLSLSVTSGYTLKSATFTYTPAKNGVLKYSGTNYTSGTTITLSGTSASFTVGHTSGSDNGNVKISAIEVTYISPTTTYYTSSPVTTVDVTISAAKYATYCGKRALDFSGKATVYTATDGETSVTLNEISTGKVPAGTPVVLYKASADGSAINVPVIASAEAFSGTNDLHVVGAGGLTGEDYIYVLAKPADKVGFFLWDKTQTLNEGKIYLQGKDSYGARSFLGFAEGETTSIDVRSKMEDVRGEVYNLNGQRVAQPTKGLYIVNGKKVVVK